ncbi:MAG: PQQ-dependent sugar dehydrogenase [Dehalococcoidia bacterium]
MAVVVLVAFAGVLLLASCSSDSSGGSESEVLRATLPPFPEAIPTPSPTNLPATPGDTPLRWGYDPSKFTGERDGATQFTGLPPGYSIETYVTGLQQPTGIAFLPDGRMLVAEQKGSIRLVDEGRLLPKPFHRIAVHSPDPGDKVVELGLVGLTVDPNFKDNGYIYAYYSASKPKRHTALARIRVEDDKVIDEWEILEINEAPSCCHISGSMRFAPDGTLFVTVGDHQKERESQDKSNVLGSILRINRDGTVPKNNPFVHEDNTDPRIYAYGLRNPFDIAIDPKTGRMFATENGFSGQDAIIEVHPRANYGWPGYNLDVPYDQVEPPLLFYHAPTGPAGIEYYRGKALPAFEGTLLFCQFHRGGALHLIKAQPDGDVRDTILATGCTSDVLTGPDGLIYFTDYVTGTIFRITRDAHGG